MIPPANIIAKSETNHSGLFSETKRHLSPSSIFSLITFDNFNIVFSVCSHVYVFLLFGFSHSKKLSFLRFLEKFLVWLPLGAQYLLILKK